MNNSAREVLKGKKLFVLDMDGTFYLDNRVLPGSMEFIDKVRNIGKEFVFFTNNSSRSGEFYVDKLNKMGCNVVRDHIMSSGDVTIDFLKNSRPGKRVYLMGTELLVKSFKDAGIDLVEENPDLVVLGFDMTMTYEKVSKACKFLRKGAEFIATHLDINCPTEDGFIPDCGAMCAMITTSTGVKPKFLGKPFTETLDAVKNKTGYGNDDIVFVGDRLYTDVATGFNHNVTSILVLSGETKFEDLEASDIKPTFVFPTLGSIAEVL